MISWEPPTPPGTLFTKAKTCNIHPGILNKDGFRKQIAAHICVDDYLLSTAWQFMQHLLAACIEAIFTVMGKPDTKLCQCPLALDK